MEILPPSSKIYLTNSKIEKAGRGVFASVDIEKDEVIEICPVIVLPKEQTRIFKETALHNYYFMWGEQLAFVAIALGYGSLYNHSYSPNATYKKQENLTLQFIAIKDIAKDEEITVNYNYGNPNDKTKLWIDEIPPASSNKI